LHFELLDDLILLINTTNVHQFEKIAKWIKLNKKYFN